MMKDDNRKCCPECGSINIYRTRTRGDFGRDVCDGDYKCNRCDLEFDDPDTSDERNTPYNIGSHSLASKLESMDADEI